MRLDGQVYILRLWNKYGETVFVCESIERARALASEFAEKFGSSSEIRMATWMGDVKK